jgi:ribosomal protein L13
MRDIGSSRACSAFVSSSIFGMVPRGESAEKSHGKVSVWKQQSNAQSSDVVR